MIIDILKCTFPQFQLNVNIKNYVKYIQLIFKRIFLH